MRESQPLLGGGLNGYAKTTNNRQVPWESSSLMGDFFFVPPTSSPPSQPAPAPVTTASVPSSFRPSVPQEAPTVGSQPQPGQVFRDTLSDGTRGPAMVVIRGGKFQMGSPESEVGRTEAEKQHEVTVKDFAIGQYEVTVGEFRRFVEAAGYRTDAERNADGNRCAVWNATDYKWDLRVGGSWRQPGYEQSDGHPVVCVSWNDAVTYAEWLAKETGQAYRLPAKAEWEYAARAGTTTTRHWGDEPNQACRYANGGDRTTKKTIPDWSRPIHDCADGFAYTAPVGSLQSNAWKLYDMLGNVWEWTCSVYDEDYGRAKAKCTEKGTTDHSVRGGAWDVEPEGVRSAYGFPVSPSRRFNDVGFRLARSL